MLLFILPSTAEELALDREMFAAEHARLPDTADADTGAEDSTVISVLSAEGAVVEVLPDPSLDGAVLMCDQAVLIHPASVRPDGFTVMPC